VAISSRALAVCEQPLEIISGQTWPAFRSAGETPEEHAAMEKILSTVGAFGRMAVSATGARALSNEQLRALTAVDQ